MRHGASLSFLGAGLLAAAFLSAIYGAAALAAEKPARVLFSDRTKPAALEPEAVGFYSRGCLAGGAMLPVTGSAWQAMRLERNRNWAHPRLVALVKRLAVESKEIDGWPGLLVGDLSQPRGGPMLTGHRSHQLGLDADIWLRPMPDRVLSRAERSEKTGISAISMIKSISEIDEKHWRPGHVKLLKRAASYPEVERIFVHPAIKKALCDATGGEERWLAKIRPYWGHHYHFHVRINCPPGSRNCRNQKPAGSDPGCGKVLDDWFALMRKAQQQTKKKGKVAKKKKRREIMVEQLPAQCRTVLTADDATPTQYATTRPPEPIRAGLVPSTRSDTAVTAAGQGAAPAPQRKPGAARKTAGSALPWLRGVAAPLPPVPDRKPR